MKILAIHSIIVAFLLLTACSTQTRLLESSEGIVRVQAKPERYLEAYDLARIECLKLDSYAEYITDESREMKIVEFNCIDPNTEDVEAEAETVGDEETI